MALGDPRERKTEEAELSTSPYLSDPPSWVTACMLIMTELANCLLFITVSVTLGKPLTSWAALKMQGQQHLVEKN